MRKLAILAILATCLYAGAAMAFSMGFLFDFNSSQNSVGYVDLQSSMIWQTYTPTPGTYAFGNHSTSTNTDKVFTLSNPGNDLLESASLAVAGTGFSLQSTTCGSNPFDLSLLTTCTATVRFSPVAGTSYSGTLTASAPNLTSQVVNLSGTGVVPPVAPSTPVISVTPGDTTNLIALTSGGTGSPTPSYDVKWGTVAGTRSNIISSVALPYTHTGRTNGTPYYYSLVATNSGGFAESSEVSGTPTASLATFTDTFVRADANPIDGTWATPAGASPFKILNNKLRATASSPASMMYSTAKTFNNNQFSQIVIADTNLGTSGPCVRVQPGSISGYWLRYVAGTLKLYKMVAGVGTQLGSDIGGGFAWANGHTIRLDVVGNTFTVYHNSTVLSSTITDNTYTTGNPGVYSGVTADILGASTIGDL